MSELEDNLNDYINGSISFLTYRERRRQYINRFIDSSYLPDDTIPLDAADQQKITDAIKQKKQETTPLDTSTYTIPNSTSSQSAKQYIGLAVLIIIAVATWYYSTKITPTSLSSSPAQIEKNAREVSKKNTFDQKFVINFLKMDQWNADTLSEFLVKWQALSRIEKKQSKQSPSFIRLKNSLRLRIHEQQALQSTKNKNAERQENLLIWFASQLSVTVN